MENYKEDIKQTRVGYLGSSDANMLAQIEKLGYVPKSAYKRLAVAKGLCEQQEIPRTPAVCFGDAMEQAIFEYLHSTDERYESNPKWVSKIYSRKNIQCLTHADITKKDEEKKILYVYEVKTSKFTFEQVRYEYRFQLCHHFMLANEYAKTLGHGWSVKVFLVHYSTDGIDLSQMNAFDPKRMTVKEIKRKRQYNLHMAMDIVDEFLETFDTYYEGEDVDAAYLPQQVRSQFDDVARTLQEIETRQKQVDEFKEMLYDFMSKKGLKSIKCETFGITLVSPSESHSFDHKKYIDDELARHPRKTRRILKEYDKVSKRKGFVQIKVKENNNTGD